MTLHGAEASSRTYAKNGADCACCHRRAFVKGASAAALATLTSRRNASAQPASPSADKPFRIDVHHHLSSPGFVEAIRSRKTGQIPLENWTPRSRSMTWTKERSQPRCFRSASRA